MDKIVITNEICKNCYYYKYDFELNMETYNCNERHYCNYWEDDTESDGYCHHFWESAEVYYRG